MKYLYNNYSQNDSQDFGKVLINEIINEYKKIDIFHTNLL